MEGITGIVFPLKLIANPKSFEPENWTLSEYIGSAEKHYSLICYTPKGSILSFWQLGTTYWSPKTLRFYRDTRYGYRERMDITLEHMTATVYRNTSFMYFNDWQTHGIYDLVPGIRVATVEEWEKKN